MDNAQLINQDSGKVEYYTPSWIIEAAREVMGSIDLDPASSAKANETVKAHDFFSKENNGLTFPWWGNVWMNHPFNKKLNKLWIEKLVNSYKKGEVSQACNICFASVSEKWFQPLMQYPQCYFYKRVVYIDGFCDKRMTASPKGSVVTYLGPNVEKFYNVFSQYGKVMVAYEY